MAKIRIGHMACPDCGSRVAVKENEHGTLSYNCDECDGNGYSKKSETRHAKWRDKITPIAPAALPTPAPKKDDEKPAPVKGRFGY